MSATGARRISTNAEIDRGTGIYIPISGTGGGGEYGALISHGDREYAIERTPVGHRVVFALAHDIWDKGFELELEGEEDEGKNKEFNDEVQKELRRLKIKRELNRMTTFERGFGWSILVISYEGTKNHAEEYKPVSEGHKKIVDVRAYGPINITSVQEDKQVLSKRYGFPLEYRVYVGTTKRLHVHYTRAIHVATRLLKHDWKGQSVLDALWNDLVNLQNIRWGMGQTMYRYGSGFPDLTFTGAERDKIQEWIDAGGISNIFARSFFAHNESQKIDFKGVGGVALDPLNYYLPIMEQISLATSIPLAILRGAQAGALTGSEVNEREYQGLLSDEQGMYEDSVIELIKAILRQPHMQAKKDDSTAQAADPVIPAFTIKWLSGMELTETEKVDLQIKKTQLIRAKGEWHTRNELRLMEDPKAKPLTPEQGGDEILGRPKITAGIGDSEYRVVTNPDGSSTVVERHKRPTADKRD